MKAGRGQRYGATNAGAKAASRKSCSACGNKGHDASKCRYRNFVCDNCKAKGHLRRACTKTASRAGAREHDRGGDQRNLFTSESLEEAQSEPEEEEGEAIFQMSLSEYRPVSLTILVNEIPLVMEVDTGTPASCISRSTYESMFSDLPIEKIRTCFNTYTGNKINPIGIIAPIVQYKDKRKRLDLYVVEKGITTLIGRQWLSNFDIQIPRFQVTNKVDSDTRRLDEGDPVWYRIYNSRDKWLQGRVIERLRRNNYNVSSAEGGVHHRHVDQLKRYTRRSTCVYPGVTEPEDAGSSGVVSGPGEAAGAGTALERQRGETSLSHAPAQGESQPADNDAPLEIDSPQISSDRNGQQSRISLPEETPLSRSVVSESQPLTPRLRRPVQKYGFEFD
ncbi:reverse transcriptase [Operophtera brumata]|uniref:Reverse transcriptase n=1 Tax=Operophtera brumata TaxID=104452 RepID=A0A0L7LGB6_OPEBR|nr:reverse transcriptase [Operophtera brumata]